MHIMQNIILAIALLTQKLPVASRDTPLFQLIQPKYCARYFTCCAKCRLYFQYASSGISIQWCRCVSKRMNYFYSPHHFRSSVMQTLQKCRNIKKLARNSTICFKPTCPRNTRCSIRCNMFVVFPELLSPANKMCCDSSLCITSWYALSATE